MTAPPVSSPAEAPRPDPAPARVAVIGGGPAGLMAAEGLLARGLRVDLYDAMPSVGRKFLLAGKGGLNLTHSEALPGFCRRYGCAEPVVTPWLARLSPEGLREWAAGLGVATFVGSSGKVFPEGMKAAPLLRGWLHRLRGQGLRLHMRHRWCPEALVPPAQPGQPWQLPFDTPQGRVTVAAEAAVLALGGGSWARLGSDGRWAAPLAQLGVAVAPLQPANCGFDLDWSPYLVERYAGAPLKNVALSTTDPQGQPWAQRGECVLTATGLEGQLVYAASAALREAIARHGQARFTLDLLPQTDAPALAQALARGRGSRSMATHLKTQAGLSGAKAALLREGLDGAAWQRLSERPGELAERIKALPLVARAPRPLDEAISSAGGVALDGLTEGLMLRRLPGLFCAGEMLDWEAPTGGYLLTACLASGRVAAEGVAAWLAADPGTPPAPHAQPPHAQTPDTPLPSP